MGRREGRLRRHGKGAAGMEGNLRQQGEVGRGCSDSKDGGGGGE